MKHLLVTFVLAGWFALVQQTTPAPALDRPLPGEAVQGVVLIQGSSAVEGFASAQVEFRYEGGSGETWFLIQDQIPAIESGTLASWDTTTITDGIYRIRLRVLRQDGNIIVVEVAGVRVRNYTAVETNTPAMMPETTHQPTATQTATPVVIRSTPTPMPPNSISVTGTELRGSALAGLGVVAALFLLLIIYRAVRRRTRRG